MSFEIDPKIKLSKEVANLYKLTETSLVDDEYVYLYQDIRRCMILAIENKISISFDIADGYVFCEFRSHVRIYVELSKYDSEEIATCIGILLCLKGVKHV